MGCIHIERFKPAIVVDGQFAFRIRLINCRLGGGHEGASLEHDALFNGFVDIAGQGRDQKRCQYGQDDQDNDQFNEGNPSFWLESQNRAIAHASRISIKPYK